MTMTFLSSTFLAALLLAAIPVLLHLLYRRKRQTIQWAAMQFLVQAAGRRRFWRLRDWLLMAMRAAIIFLFILAMSRPVIQWQPAIKAINHVNSILGYTNNALGDYGGDVILIIDTSLSTSRQSDNNETILNKIISRALQATAELGEQDLLRVMETASQTGGRWIWPGARQVNQHAIKTLQTDLESLTPGKSPANIPAAIQTAANAITLDDKRQRIIVVVADNTAHGFSAQQLDAWLALNNSLQQYSLPTAVRIILIDDHQPQIANLAISPIATNRPIAIINQPLYLSTTITNPSNHPSQPTIARWKIQGQQVAISTVEQIPPGETSYIDAHITTTQPPANTDQIHITCEIDLNDQLTLDNQSELFLPTANAIKILIVENPAVIGQSKYLQTAAGNINRQTYPLAKHPKSPFGLTVINSNQPPDESFSQYHCIVICDAMDWPPSAMHRLKQFVNRGGGLWLAVNEAVRPAIFNETFYQAATGLSPVALGQSINHNLDNNPQTIEITDQPHDAIKLLQQLASLDLQQASIYRRHQLLLTNTSNHRNITQLINIAQSNDILAAASTFSRGRVIVQGLSLDLSDSDWPLWRGYVVLVNEWLWYLSENAIPKYNITPGQQAIWFANSNQLSKTEIMTPREQVFAVSPDDNNIFHFNQTHAAGRYTITNPTAADKYLAVHRDPDESNLQPLSSTQISSITQAASIEFLDSSDEPVFAPFAAAKTIWQELFILVLLIMIIEMWLAGWLTRRQRSLAVE